MPLTQSLFVTTASYAVQQVTLKSPAFPHMGEIPQKYSNDGANISPPLIVGKIPDETRSMALIVEDTKAPVDSWVHWLVWDIFPSKYINEGAIPGTEGLNAFNHHHYRGPCHGNDTRYYYFMLYALDTFLHLHYCSTKYEVMKSIKDHVIGYGELVGSYTRRGEARMQLNEAPEIYY